MKNYIVIAIILLVCIAPNVVSQEETTSPGTAEQEQKPAPRAARNTINVRGDSLVSVDGSITVVPTVIDEELHNKALILRSIGVPLYDTGEVLIGISVATWVLWTVAMIPQVIGVSLAELLGGSSADVNIDSALTTTLLGASVGLTLTGLSALVSGGVLTLVGNDYRDRSFSTLE